MLLETLRHQIATLNQEAFEQASTCIDSIREAIAKAGPTGVLALEYTRIAHQEQLVNALKTSQLALELSLGQRESLAKDVLSLKKALQAVNYKLAKMMKKSTKPVRAAKKKKTK